MRKNIILLLFLLINSTLFAQELEVGDKAPEIVMNSIDGKEIKLSDLEGKMVLIDFWASWCGPCRRENPNIVEAYHKYKDQEFDDATGFTVFSVSLDMKKDKWKAAIEKDNLVWPYHVSDLKGWFNGAAKTYKIKSVPTSYLINGEGVIIAKNLRGKELEKELRKSKKGLLNF